MCKKVDLTDDDPTATFLLVSVEGLQGKCERGIFHRTLPISKTMTDFSSDLSFPEWTYTKAEAVTAQSAMAAVVNFMVVFYFLNPA